MLKLLASLYQRLHLKIIPVQKTYDRKPTTENLRADTITENLRIYIGDAENLRRNSPFYDCLLGSTHITRQ